MRSRAVSFVGWGGTGAALGRRLLDALGVFDPAARGLVMGSTAHGLGTAALAAEEPEAFAFAAVAMALVGTVSTAAVTLAPVRAALRATAGV
jgi:putative effector of murein hydrolase